MGRSSIGIHLRRGGHKTRAHALLLASLASLPLGSAAAEARAQEQPAASRGGAQQPEDEQGKPDPRPKFEEQIVVTAGRTEQKLGDLPVHATVVSPEEVRRSPAQTVADMLAQVPSFNLQRAMSSRFATPPTQAVNLRSMGGSGASRALVLVDGVPLNDPFFGWIAWSQVSRAGVERIEVVPAGGAGAWGNQALGGVINVITRTPEKATFDLDARYGSLDTVDLDLGFSDVRGPLGFSARAGYFDTDGYFPLPQEVRGPVDTKSASRSYLFQTRLQYDSSPATRWVLQGRYLDDDRTSGTPLSTDQGQVLTLSLGGDFATRAGQSFHLNAFGVLRNGSSTRGSISADRTSERPNRDQFDLPSSVLAAGANWSRSFSRNHVVSGGADLHWTDGEVYDDSQWVVDRFTRRNITGGEQLLVGLYGQDAAQLGSRWRITPAARLDLWHPSDGMDFLQNLDSGAVLRDTHLPSRDEWVFSPSLGAVYRAADRLALRSSLYRTFRAPTPNELYKPALVGSRSVNWPNPNLEPERLAGLEAGFDYSVGNTFSGRITGFWNVIENPINDVTVGIAGGTPQLIPPCGLVAARGTCREKQNLDRARNRGGELELQLRPGRSVRVAAAYAYAESRVTSSPNQPQLEGKRLRRVPEHQLSVRAEYVNPSVVTASLQGRYLGDRYQDDQNTLYIDDSFVLDLSLSRRVGRKLELFLIGENILDTAFEIDNASDGVEYGHPRLVHLGLRFRWQAGRPGP